jgi:hypothetical protein
MAAITVSPAIASAAVFDRVAARSRASRASSAAPPAIGTGTPAQKTTIATAPMIARMSEPRSRFPMRGTMAQKTIAVTAAEIAKTMSQLRHS